MCFLAKLQYKPIEAACIAYSATMKQLHSVLNSKKRQTDKPTDYCITCLCMHTIRYNDNTQFTYHCVNI